MDTAESLEVHWRLYISIWLHQPTFVLEALDLGKAVLPMLILRCDILYYEQAFLGSSSCQPVGLPDAYRSPEYS